MHVSVGLLYIYKCSFDENNPLHSKHFQLRFTCSQEVGIVEMRVLFPSYGIIKSCSLRNFTCTYKFGYISIYVGRGIF